MPGQLFPLIDAHFNEEELRTLCLMLGLEYESLGGRGKTNPITVPATLPTRFYRLFKP